MRKLGLSMSEEEKQSIHERLLRLYAGNTITWSKHFRHQIRKRKIKERHIAYVLDSTIRKEYNIIEVNYPNEGRIQVLIRSKKSFQGRNICLVLSLISPVLVTAYSNAENDHHATLMTEYNDSLDIIELLKKHKPMES